MKRTISLLLAALLLSSCSAGAEDLAEAAYARFGFAEADRFRSESAETISAAADLEMSFEDELTPSRPVVIDLSEENEEEEAEDGPVYPNMPAEPELFPMRIYDSMTLYPSIGAEASSSVLAKGTTVYLKETADPAWAEVRGADGGILGYARDGFMHAVGENSAVYAVLPVEYGQAKTNQETYVQAYSHLVDVRRYFNTVECPDENFSALDLDGVDFVISMKLSTNETSIGEPFYHRNLCLLQYDILPMLRDAVERFRADGFTVVIYDAYRPTSVQQRWFDVIRVHKWVADPSIGMGGVHDRGTAIDMSLIDRNGNLLEMPTPMHTFTEESARTSPTMTATARGNMDYMLSVMLACGFTYINSEWWHFQDVNTKFYLPTDHPIDEIPLVVMERTAD